MSGIDPNARVNLAKATFAVIDGSQHSLDVTAQILKGFGVGVVQRFSEIAEADKFAKLKAIDLIIIDPSVEDGAGYDFIRDLRHSAGPSAFSPVILVSGHVRKADVSRARDTGANFVVAKPLSPQVLLQRVLWVSRDKRPFVEVGNYIGPDRRFKFEGPPIGSDGRRSDDAGLTTPLGDAAEPNMSQDEVDAFIKPQRVMI
ncbi:MAG: response regulator [Hyphomonadaceae bacterium]